MKKINVVYFEQYSDADILLVQDQFAENVDKMLQEFFDYVAAPENRNRFLVPLNGRMVLGIGTKELIWWLNNVAFPNNEEASIVKRNTNYCKDIPTAYM